MRYGRFTDGIYCANEITKQLAVRGISYSQSMALGEIGSNGRFINIGRERWQGAGEVAGRRRGGRAQGARVRRGGRAQGAIVVALVAPWR